MRQAIDPALSAACWLAGATNEREAVRPEYLGCRGYRHPIALHLDGFAKEAAVLRRAHSAADSAIPGDVSILTRHYPRTHDVFLAAAGCGANRSYVPRHAEVWHLAESTTRGSYGS